MQKVHASWKPQSLISCGNLPFSLYDIFGAEQLRDWLLPTRPPRSSLQSTGGWQSEVAVAALSAVSPRAVFCLSPHSSAPHLLLKPRKRLFSTVRLQLKLRFWQDWDCDSSGWSPLCQAPAMSTRGHAGRTKLGSLAGEPAPLDGQVCRRLLLPPGPVHSSQALWLRPVRGPPQEHGKR